MIVGALLNVIAHDEEVLIVFGILMIFARDIGIICLKMEWRDIMRSIILGSICFHCYDIFFSTQFQTSYRKNQNSHNNQPIDAHFIHKIFSSKQH